MTIDNKIRELFIGLDKKIFFNNASYAPMLKSVKKQIDAYLEEVFDLKSADELSWNYLDQLRNDAAALVGATTEEVGFALNTSWGIGLAVTGLDYKPGDEVVFPDNEFPSLIYPFRILEEKGVKLKLMPCGDGNFSLDALKKVVSPRTKLLGISFVHYHNGFRNDLKAIGQFCRERDIFLLVDGIQGVGACLIDVHDCQIDLLACGAQKWLLSPLGSGFFFLSRNAKRQLRSYSTGWLGVEWGFKFSDLRHFDRTPFEDAKRFNLGTYPYMQLWAMAEAVRFLRELGIENIFRHNLGLLDRIIRYVQDNGYYYLKSSLEPMHRSQILSIGSPAGEELARYLLKEGIYLVYREGGVRVAVNLYNTMEEIEFLIERLETFKQSHVSSSRSAVK